MCQVFSQVPEAILPVMFNFVSDIIFFFLWHIQANLRVVESMLNGASKLGDGTEGPLNALTVCPANMFTVILNAWAMGIFEWVRMPGTFKNVFIHFPKKARFM